MKIMKTLFTLFFSGLFLFVNTVLAEPAPMDKIVAIVNKDVITQSALDKRTSMLKKQLGGGDATNDALLRQKALDELIDLSLQVQLAKKNNIIISDKELDAFIANIAKMHNITVDKLKEVLPSQEGISFKEIRKQLLEQGLIRRVHQLYLGKEIVVTKKDIAKVMSNPPQFSGAPKTYHVYDILVAVADDSPKDKIESAKKVAHRIVEKLRLMAKLKQAKSIDDVVKETQDVFKDQTITGDDLGWRKGSELPELFVKDVTNMKVDEVVGPINAPNGLHLLKLLDVNGGQAAEKLTENQAAEIAYQMKLAEKLRPWLKEVRANAYIKIVK